MKKCTAKQLMYIKQRLLERENLSDNYIIKNYLIDESDLKYIQEGEIVSFNYKSPNMKKYYATIFYNSHPEDRKYWLCISDDLVEIKETINFYHKMKLSYA